MCSRHDRKYVTNVFSVVNTQTEDDQSVQHVHSPKYPAHMETMFTELN
jgi:hypothetical protein